MVDHSYPIQTSGDIAIVIPSKSPMKIWFWEIFRENMWENLGWCKLYIAASWSFQHKETMLVDPPQGGFPSHGLPLVIIHVKMDFPWNQASRVPFMETSVEWIGHGNHMETKINSIGFSAMLTFYEDSLVDRCRCQGTEGLHSTLQLQAELIGARQRGHGPPPVMAGRSGGYNSLWNAGYDAYLVVISWNWSYIRSSIEIAFKFIWSSLQFSCIQNMIWFKLQFDTIARNDSHTLQPQELEWGETWRKGGQQWLVEYLLMLTGKGPTSMAEACRPCGWDASPMLFRVVS